MIEIQKKYNKVIVFSGGGTRFAIYCGMYSAMVDLGIQPDLIIGSCGGSIATTIIKCFPESKNQKEFLKSDELYKFVKNTQLTKQRELDKIGLFSLKKIFCNKNAPYFEDVFNRYLVKMDDDISTLLPSLVKEKKGSVKSIIIGSEILLDNNLINKPRKNKKIYQKILFTDEETASFIDTNAIVIQGNNYLNSAVSSEIKTITNLPIHSAMRISLSDMFYTKPVFLNNRYFAGGVIDLMPIELAKHMANTVIMEHKKGYSFMEEGLIRAVLGFSGNERMKDVKNQDIDHWIDTSDIKTALKNYYCEKYIDWSKLRIDITLPKTYKQFCNDMDMQWLYGYNKIMQNFS